MPTYNTYEELQRAVLKKYIITAQNKVTELLLYQLKKFMMEMYYDTYSPEYYQRSYDLFKSAVKVDAKIVGDRIISQVYLDPNALKETTFNYEYRDQFGKKKTGKGIRHAWNDKQEIINQTAFGGLGQGIRAAQPTIDMTKQGFSYGTPGDNNNVDESYWLAFLDYAFKNTKSKIIEELREQGVEVV